MDEQNEKIFKYIRCGELEGHPLNIDKIIKGDLREKYVTVNMLKVRLPGTTTGTLLYDKRTDGVPKSWFILDFEKGGRFKLPSED